MSPTVLALAALFLLAAQGPPRTTPLARVPEAAVRAVAVEAYNADGNVSAFQRDFAAGISRLCPGCNYQIVPLVPPALRSSITAGAYGPISGFYLSASDLIRARKPIAGAVWTEGVTVVIVPSTAAAPNIERVVVTRDGKTIAPLSSTLQSAAVGRGSEIQATLNTGRIVFPLAAFDPGADVRITLVPADGSSFVTRLSRADTAMLR